MTNPILEGPVLDNPPSPKAIGAGIGSLVATVLLALLMYLNTEQGVQLYAALPVLLIVGLKSILTGLATLIVSYRLTDPQRILDLATSPKVIAATLVSVVATAAVEVLNFLLTPDGQSLYSSWPPLAVVALSAGIPAVAAALAGYIVKDPARLTKDNPHPVASIPAVPESVDVELDMPDFSGFTPQDIVGEIRKRENDGL